MSAHPMLQPVDWSRPPESLEREIAPDRLDVYRIVWNSAIAVTLRAPYLVYRRSLLKAGEHLVSCMTVTVSPSRRGYWPFRQDFPAQPWPLSAVAPAGSATLSVQEARSVRAAGISLGELMLEMETRGIGTPATTASMLQAALETNGRRLGPTLQLEFRHSLASYDQRWLVRLTPAGQASLARWQAANLIPDSNARRQDIEQVANGEEPLEAVLERRFPEVPVQVRERIGKEIAAICDRWRGLSQTDGLRALAGLQAKPPKLSGLPRWIDPEQLLPSDHPLRRIREEMESELAVQHPLWMTFSNEEKAGYRKAWLVNRRVSEPAIPVLDGEGSQFNAVVHWLLGVALNLAHSE